LFPESLFGLLDGLTEDLHELVVVALVVLEVLHELEVLGEEVAVVRQVLEVVLYQLFRVLVVLIIFHHKVAVLYQHIRQSLEITTVHAQHRVIRLLGHRVVLLPDLKLDVALVGLQRGVYPAKLLVHLSRLRGVLPFLQVAPVKEQLLAELYEKHPIVPQNAQHLRVLVRLMFKVVEHLVPQLEIVSLGHQ
jgi:hypothetical protein